MNGGFPVPHFLSFSPNSTLSLWFALLSLSPLPPTLIGCNQIPPQAWSGGGQAGGGF